VEVLLIRHGEPEWVRDGLSVDDPPLTERGRRQADGLAERLANEDPPVQEIWVSPLRRAQQTAAPIVERLGLEARTFDWLAEIGAPRWDGTPVEVVERVFAETWTRPLDELWDGLPGGESFRAFHRRVVDGLRDHIDGLGVVATSDEPRLWNLVEPDRRVAVVAHGGTNATLLAFLLGIPPVPWEWERFVSYHASISVVRPFAISDTYAFTMLRFSDVAHFPPELQTR
jgi:2,3-bisphosphoglycerate-dependent phosphoglycerate mutase